MNPNATVLTVVHNGGRYLGQAISSIQTQTVSELEHIVVDDASDDDSAQIVETIAKLDPRVRLVRLEDRVGPYRAANRGLESARGRYVVRIDADDVAFPHRIESQLAFLAVHPELRACASFCRVLTEDGYQVGAEARLPLLPGALKWRLAARAALVHSTACVERTSLEELGGYRELPASQDYRLWCELSRRGWLGVVPEVLVYWRLHGHQLSTEIVDLQERLAVDVLRDHLAQLDPEPWSDDELAALRFVGWPRWTSVPRDGHVLRRFKELWKRDTSLADDERRELAAFTRKLRRERLGRVLRPSAGLPAVTDSEEPTERTWVPAQTQAAEPRSHGEVPASRLAVCVPTVDRPAALRRVLASIARQAMRPDVVLVVDASTSESSRTVCNELASIFPDGVLVYERAERGLPRQRRIGIEILRRRSDVRYICFLDDDVVLEPAFLSTIVGFMEGEGSRFGGVSGYDVAGWGLRFRRLERLYRRLGIFDGPLHPGRWLYCGYFLDSYLFPQVDRVHECELICGGLTVWRSSVYDEFLPPLEMKDYALGEDKHFSLRVHTRYPLAVHGGARAWHLPAPTGRPRRFRLAYQYVRLHVLLLRDCDPTHSMKRVLAYLGFQFVNTTVELLSTLLRMQLDNIVTPAGWAVGWLSCIASPPRRTSDSLPNRRWRKPRS